MPLLLLKECKLSHHLDLTSSLNQQDNFRKHINYLMSYVILRVFPDFICAQPTNKTNPPLLKGLGNLEDAILSSLFGVISSKREDMENKWKNTLLRIASSRFPRPFSIGEIL